MNIEKISKITLWVLMGISAIIFILFFVVNFDNKWEENPKMNDPQFTDALIIWALVLTVATLIMMLVSFFMYVKEYGFNKSYLYTWGLPIITLAIGAGAMTVSHANDSYFWVVTNFGEMTPEQGYKTETLNTLFMGIASIIEIFILSLFLH